MGIVQRRTGGGPHHDKGAYAAAIGTILGRMYFGEPEADALLLQIRRLMDVQSQFWFDCVSSDAVGDRTRLPEVKLFMDSMRMIGEPFVRGFEKIKEELSDLGLRVLEKSSAAEMLGESDPVFRHYSFARCAS